MRLSNCCDAQIIYSDICSECKEHCDRRDTNIRRSAVPQHYPDFNAKTKKYVVPPKRRNNNE